MNLEDALARLQADLTAIGPRWALIGGLAVSVRAEPRSTRDLDVVIAVASDQEAEGIVLALRLRGYKDHPDGALIEKKDTGRLATVRLLFPTPSEPEIGVDLLFASSGVEPEIVAGAEAVGIAPGLFVPVARIGHLLALKVLAGRPRDIDDIGWLLKKADLAEIQLAEESLRLIVRRPLFNNPERDLLLEFSTFLEKHR